MIIWINGSFGVGKTSVSEVLNKKIDNSIIYDPENIGTFLSDMFNNEKDDFQDYDLWRTINYEILKYMVSTYEIVIVPMTITNYKYYEEIIKDLDVKHFILCASKEKIIERLDNRGNSTKWAYNQVDRCIEAFNINEFGATKIDTDNISVDEVGEKILKNIYVK